LWKLLESGSVSTSARRFVFRYWKRLAGIALVGLMATGIGLAQPYFSKLLIDSALLRGDMFPAGCEYRFRM